MSFTSSLCSQPSVAQNSPEDIQLSIRDGEKLRVFQLSANDERVVTVGATPSADVQFDMPEVSPIHFYIERLDDELWIVPAYCVSGLKLNHTNVRTPQRLKSPSTVEFGGIALELEVHRPAHELVAPNFGYSDLHDANDTAGEDDEPTHQAWSTIDPARAPLERSLVTLMLAPPQLTSALEYHTETPLSTEHDVTTEKQHRLHPIAVSRQEPRISTAMQAPRRPRALAATVDVSRIRSVPPDVTEPRASKPDMSPPQLRHAQVSSLKRTLYGVSPSLFGTDNPKLAPPVSRHCATQVLPPFLAHRRPARKMEPLCRLGQLVRESPLRMLAIAVAAALLSALLVVLITDTILHLREIGPMNSPSHRVLIGNP